MKKINYKSTFLIMLFTITIFSLGWNGGLNKYDKTTYLLEGTNGKINNADPALNHHSLEDLPSLHEWEINPPRLFYPESQQVAEEIDFSLQSIQATNYSSHDPITITSNDDFGPSGYNFPGRGDISAPYLITQLNITNSSKHLISISDTDVYFSIDDNLLNGITGAYNGIYLVNVTHGEIHNNSVKLTNYGIYLSNSNDSVIDSNSVFQSGLDGIKLDTSSSNVIIASNHVTNNTKRGILVNSVFDISISFNTISWNDAQGISVWNSDNVTIEYNLVEDSWGSGIFVMTTSTLRILFNDVYRNLRILLEYQNVTGSGISVVASDGIISKNMVANNYEYGMLFSSGAAVDILNNTIEMNSKSGIYFEYYNESRFFGNRIGANNANGIVFNSSHYNYVDHNIIGRNGANGIFLVDSHDNYFEYNEIYGNSGTTANPIPVALFSIQGSTTGHGIFLDPSHRNVINDNTIYSNTGSGLFLLGSEFSSIGHNVIFENFENGLFLENSNNNEIARNDIFLNGDFTSDPISTDNGMFFSIQGSTTGHGIFLDPSDKNTIFENNIFDNQGNGISLQESDETQIYGNYIGNNLNGVYLENSSYNNISHNTISRSGIIPVEPLGSGLEFSIMGSTTGHGIFLDPSDYNHLEGNNIYDSVQNGIFIVDSDNTKVLNNILSVNGLYGVQVDFASSEALINQNDFFQNNFGQGSQASDDGLDNLFDGNYWSDLPFGVDGYYLDGESDNVDTNPSKTPINLPEYNFGGLIVVYPNGGEKLSGEAALLWTRMYSDSTPIEDIQYWLFHSDNNGDSWNNIPLNEYSTETLPDGTIAIRFVWDTTTVTNGDSNLIKVVGVDNLGFSRSDTSDEVFIIDNELDTTTEPSTTTTTTTTTDSLTPGWTLLISLGGIGIILRLKRRKSE